MATNQLPTICLDSCVVIDCLEKRADNFPFLKPILEEAAAKKLMIVVSTLAIAETIKISGVEPDRQHDLITGFFENDYIYIQNADLRVARIAQKIRRSNSIGSADAIMIATAIATDSSFFLTRDGDSKRLHRKILPLDDKFSIRNGKLRIMIPEHYHKLQIELANPLLNVPEASADSKQIKNPKALWDRMIHGIKIAQFTGTAPHRPQ